MTYYPLFVYGTLRHGGAYHHLYLRYAPCVHPYYVLPGFVLYDYVGEYPFMVREADRQVVGEVYRINEVTKAALDNFEDVRERLYDFVYLPGHHFYTYLKHDPFVGDMPRVPGGDWIAYHKNLPDG